MLCGFNMLLVQYANVMCVHSSYAKVQNALKWMLHQDTVLGIG